MPPVPRLLDISRPLYTGAPHWPGDLGTSFRLVSRIADGRAANVGHLEIGIHSGTHADAPYHYCENGARIDELSPDLFVGASRVIDARGASSFTPALFAGLAPEVLTMTPRVLFRTDVWSDPATFPTTWPLLAPGMAGWLAAAGVALIGLDVPSVDPVDSTGMAIHHQLHAAGILILESLDLHGIDAGVYELIALPLKVRGADGSPVRAVLRRVP